MKLDRIETISDHLVAARHSCSTDAGCCYERAGGEGVENAARRVQERGEHCVYVVLDLAVPAAHCWLFVLG